MNLIYTSTAILLFLTPILISPITKEIFEFPKTIFLYLVTGIFLILSKKKIHFKKIYLPYFLILGTTFVSTLFSTYKYTAFFGYYTRFNGGLISMICYVIIVIIITNNINLNKKLVKPLIDVTIISGVIVGIYSILQRFGIDNSIWVNDSSLRTFSTFGQPNWLAAYLIPILFLTIWKGFKKTFLGILLSSLVYAGFWFTYSISGIITLIITIIIFTLLIHKDIKHNLFYLLSLFVVFTIISFSYLGTFEHRIINIKKNLIGTNLIQKALAVEYAPDTVKTEDTGNIRLILWEGSLNMIKSSPKQFLIGSGPQTFVYAFQKYMPKEINKTSEANIIHNKPHNWFVEIATDLGVLGLFSYLIYIFYFSYTFAKGYIKNRKNNSILKIALFTGWLSISISSFFGWPTVTTMLMFFIWPVFFTNVDNL